MYNYLLLKNILYIVLLHSEYIQLCKLKHLNYLNKFLPINHMLYNYMLHQLFYKIHQRKQMLQLQKLLNLPLQMLQYYIQVTNNQDYIKYM